MYSQLPREIYCNTNHNCLVSQLLEQSRLLLYFMLNAENVPLIHNLYQLLSVIQERNDKNERIHNLQSFRLFTPHISFKSVCELTMTINKHQIHLVCFYRDSPTKLDRDVLSAIENTEIDPQKYPSIQKWRSTVKSYSVSDMQR